MSNTNKIPPGGYSSTDTDTDSEGKTRNNIIRNHKIEVGGKINR